MKQLSSVLTLLALTWGLCFLPVCLAVFLYRLNGLLVFIYLLIGLLIFSGIAVLRLSRHSDDRRRQSRDQSQANTEEVQQQR